jgi:hypothetical protein
MYTLDKKYDKNRFNKRSNSLLKERDSSKNSKSQALISSLSK